MPFFLLQTAIPHSASALDLPELRLYTLSGKPYPLTLVHLRELHSARKKAEARRSALGLLASVRGSSGTIPKADQEAALS